MTDATAKTYRAPVLPFDYPADDDSIWPCRDCYPWHVDVFADPFTGEPRVREWYAVGCEIWSRDGHEIPPGGM